MPDKFAPPGCLVTSERRELSHVGLSLFLAHHLTIQRQGTGSVPLLAHQGGKIQQRGLVIRIDGE